MYLWTKSIFAFEPNHCEAQKLLLDTLDHDREFTSAIFLSVFVDFIVLEIQYCVSRYEVSVSALV